jgi:hypothetical protein
LIRDDFNTVAAAYGAELEQRHARYRQHTPLPWSLFKRKPPSPAITIESSTADVLRVGAAPNRSFGQQASAIQQQAWELTPQKGSAWFRQGVYEDAQYQAEMLLVALMLVEHHQPGTVLLDQDDYGADVWQDISRWTQRALWVTLEAPPGHGPADYDSDDHDPAPQAPAARPIRSGPGR